jgi:phage terminase large subunit
MANQLREKLIPVLPKQEQFLDATEREVLYSGAFGAGKSRVGCIKLIQHAQIPGNYVGMFRRYFASLKSTTLRTLLHEPDIYGNYILPEGTYEYNKSDHEIHVKGGGTIVYGGFDKPERIGSLQLGAAFIDEGTELDEFQYTMLEGRLRHPVDPNPQIFTATNPAAPSHFLFKRFFEEQDPTRLAISATTAENFFLSESYIEAMSKLTGTARDRYFLGKWVAFEGLVYEMWDRAKFVMEKAVPETGWRSIVAGVDEGTTNPFAIVAGGLDGDGRLHIFDERYKTGLTHDDMIEEAKPFQADVYAVDPSANTLILAMRRAGLNAVAATNDLLPGIGVVRNRFTFDVLGEPRLTISPSCTNLMAEIEAYRWNDKAKKERPIQEFDHACDALRYLCMYLDSRPQVGVMVHNPHEQPEPAEPETETEQRERLWNNPRIWSRR